MSATSSTTRSWSWHQTPRLRARGPPTDELRSALGRSRPFLSDGESFKLALKRLLQYNRRALVSRGAGQTLRVVRCLLWACFGVLFLHPTRRANRRHGSRVRSAASALSLARCGPNPSVDAPPKVRFAADSQLEGTG